jgi:hypothetical protein
MAWDIVRMMTDYLTLRARVMDTNRIVHKAVERAEDAFQRGVLYAYAQEEKFNDRTGEQR